MPERTQKFVCKAEADGGWADPFFSDQLAMVVTFSVFKLFCSALDIAEIVLGTLSVFGILCVVSGG